MRSPRRWMAICAAVALAATALTPLEGEAAGWIKFLDPPDENYYGDPDIPDGRLDISDTEGLVMIALRTPFGVVFVRLNLAGPLRSAARLQRDQRVPIE